ncbi:hypothetical protein HKX48_009390 [Thoreauomyces humboldtii]|nr:hypothetical protein HKX48_009390 [Thoreauomyces humboldtii]
MYMIRYRNAVHSTPCTPRSLGAPTTCTPTAVTTPTAPARVSRCGRRLFLTTLIVASKFLQDRNYSMKAWSRICGLPTSELCENERDFLSVVDYDLCVPGATWDRWTAAITKDVRPGSGERTGVAAVEGSSCRVPLSSHRRSPMARPCPRSRSASSESTIDE